MLALAPAARAAEPADTVGADRRLNEVVVTGQSASRRVTGARIGVEQLELERLASVPVIFGERDIIKSITLLPGVHAEGDGAGGFEVRGGTAWQNLVTLDGITLYNPTHVMGIFSTFNDDALSRATLFKGPVPACYGGATSSALDVGLASGDTERYHASGTIGLLAAKLNASGPIVTDRLSFAVAARRSYVDAFLNLVPQYRNTIMNFYDITAKLHWQAAPGHIVDGSFFIGRDNMAIKEVMGMRWGNVGGSLGWLATAGRNWRFQTVAAVTSYTTRMEMSLNEAESAIREYIRDYSVNEKITARIADGHSLEFGVRSQLLRVMSGEMSYQSLMEREVRSGWQNALWSEYSGDFGRSFSVVGGVRLSLFTALSAPRFHEFTSLSGVAPQFRARTYFDAEPRLSLKWAVTERHSLKAGFFTATQNLHAIRSSSTSFPFDRYALTSADVSPERSLQYSLGYNGMTPSGAWDWSAELYYKDMRNVYDYRDGLSMTSDIALETLILGGRGRSYGAEFMVRKNVGRLTGWASYTLSRTRTRIPGINGGRWYNAGNERRHDFAAVAVYDINGSWTVSGSWVYSSGHPLTAPDVKYQIDNATCYYFSERNAYKTPPTHRLDVSATYTHAGPKLTYQWSFGIYNLYNRLNPFIVYFEDDATHPAGTRAVQQALYGILPSVSYTLKF